jgi:hypothetical protein
MNHTYFSVTNPYNEDSVLCGTRIEVSQTIGDLNTSPLMREVQGSRISRFLRGKFKKHIFQFLREVHGTGYLTF